VEEREEEAFSKLFEAKWNIPRAVDYLGKDASPSEWENMKEKFRHFCSINPATWEG
jgi:hypothetical protein